MITSLTETLCACQVNKYGLQTRFVSASEAASYQLIYVDNQTNHAIIKVTVDWNYKRNSVRITTTDLFLIALGSLTCIMCLREFVWKSSCDHIPSHSPFVLARQPGCRNHLIGLRVGKCVIGIYFP